MSLAVRIDGTQNSGEKAEANAQVHRDVLGLAVTPWVCRVKDVDERRGCTVHVQREPGALRAKKRGQEWSDFKVMKVFRVRQAGDKFVRSKAFRGTSSKTS